MDVEIFNDEELLQEASGHPLGAVAGAVNWTSPLNMLLGVFTAGLWYVVLVVRAASSGDLAAPKYIVTDERIIESTGLVGSSTTQYEFEQLVGDLETEQGFIQSLIDVGDITFEIQKTRATSASTGKVGERERSEMNKDVRREEIRLEGVQNHTEVANTIRRIHRD